MVSGVRSSWETSARKRRCRSGTIFGSSSTSKIRVAMRSPCFSQMVPRDARCQTLAHTTLIRHLVSGIRLLICHDDRAGHEIRVRLAVVEAIS